MATRGTNKETGAHSQARPSHLQPPFPISHSLIAKADIIFPAAVRRDSGLILPEQELDRFLTAELRTPKLDSIHDLLWLAGLPIPARSLNRQLLMNRRIALTERPDEHLVWYQDRIFVKPLPPFLLSYDFWVAHLCHDEDLYRSACGLLLSYVWLLSYEADFAIATKMRLVPQGVEWTAWASAMAPFVAGLDLNTMAQLDRRYHYGELRLSRLNSIMRYMVPSLWSMRNFVDGFMSTSTWHSAFFERNFGWLLAVFVYLTVLLSALQVGLSTSRLAGNESFQDMAFGIALASVAAVFTGVVAVFFVWFSLFWYYLLRTYFFTRGVIKDRSRDVGTAG